MKDAVGKNGFTKDNWRHACFGKNLAMLNQLFLLSNPISSSYLLRSWDLDISFQ